VSSDALLAGRLHALLLNSLIEEGQRQLTICNACRYCEGYCAVFPALELRPELRLTDVTHLANLCHDCGACLQACMYAPPHEFGVDIPTVMREVREATYVEYAWPRRIAATLWAHPYATLTMTTIVGSALALTTALGLRGGAALLSPHNQPGAFYAVIPWLAMMIPAMVASAFILAVMTGSVATFWRSGRGDSVAFANPKAWSGAIADALRLRYLKGGGPGCPYPDDERPSGARRWFHHLVFYGFVADFASTVSAAFEQDLFGRLPPYPVLSLPVVLGSLGGVALIAGCSGLLYLKLDAWNLHRDRPSPQDVGFLVILDLVALTGMALLVFRGSSAMGTLLTAHMGTLFALYFTLPYGKFVHGAYRFAALLRNRIDETSADSRSELST
jgi:citrate/tricarballylate utilization protein